MWVIILLPDVAEIFTPSILMLGVEPSLNMRVKVISSVVVKPMIVDDSSFRHSV